jgi:hypothetical protein
VFGVEVDQLDEEKEVKRGHWRWSNAGLSWTCARSCSTVKVQASVFDQTPGEEVTWHTMARSGRWWCTLTSWREERQWHVAGGEGTQVLRPVVTNLTRLVAIQRLGELSGNGQTQAVAC